MEMYEKAFTYTDLEKFSAGKLMHLYDKRVKELEKIREEVEEKKNEMESKAK